MPPMIAGFIARTVGSQILGKVAGGGEDEKKAKKEEEGGGLPPPLNMIPGAQVGAELLKKLGIGGEEGK
jgi:hypothetical protein